MWIHKTSFFGPRRLQKNYSYLSGSTGFNLEAFVAGYKVTKTQIKKVNCKEGDSLEVDQVILEFK